MNQKKIITKIRFSHYHGNIMCRTLLTRNHCTFITTAPAVHRLQPDCGAIRRFEHQSHWRAKHVTFIILLMPSKVKRSQGSIGALSMDPHKPHRVTGNSLGEMAYFQ